MPVTHTMAPILAGAGVVGRGAIPGIPTGGAVIRGTVMDTATAGTITMAITMDAGLDMRVNTVLVLGSQSQAGVPAIQGIEAQ